ncbi:MAG: PhnD/SsuA/transferrin family substrate-binding protein [Gammaproteobacteria bacterium]
MPFTSRIKLFLYLTSLLAILSLPISQAHAKKSLIRIGVLKIWGEDTARSMWQPTIDYLNQKLPQYNFQLVTLNLAETYSATSEKNIDFILTNSGNYVSLQANYDVARILTLRVHRQGYITTRFGAVIFTRSDRDDIQSLTDLKNKSFMGVKEAAFGGFQMAWYKLKKHDIDPYSDFKNLSFSGFPQDKVAHAVLSKQIDAGTYLKNLPVNFLKIDGSFVCNMDTDPVNAAMVESIIQVGHKIGLEIIAEYVENEAILEQLKSMGANYAQGYGIAKPLPIETLSNNQTDVA